MALMDIITKAGGDAIFTQIGERVGMTPAQAESAAAALLPKLAGAMKQHALGADLGNLIGQVGHPPGAAITDDTASMGNELLGHLFGSLDASHAAVGQAAATTGIGADQLKAFMPLLASLGAGALNSHAASGGAAGGLGGILATFDHDGDGSPMNDLMGMAGKFLK